MSRKKEHSLTPEEQNQTQQVLAHYREIDQQLMGSTDQAQEVQALTPLTDLSETAQVACLKALAKEQTIEAANVLAAVGELAPAKEVRKEARRSLIQLEGAKLYPRWTSRFTLLPFDRFAQVEPEDTTPARFWKGFYTDSRDVGEMQLLLFWEQGEEYRQARMMGFLLDFFSNGVKDFFTEVHSKRHMEKHIEEVREQFVDIDLVNCSLAQGRRLLEEALEVNKQSGTKPGAEYSHYLPLIQQLILDAPESEIEDEASTGSSAPAPLRKQMPSSPFEMLNSMLSGSGLSEEMSAFESFFSSMIYQEVVGTFLERWAEGDYEAVYELLSSSSPLRAGMTRKAWSQLRAQWSSEARPANFKAMYLAPAKDASTLELENELLFADEDEDEDDLFLEDDEFDEEDEDELDEDLDEEDEDDLQPTIEVGWSLEYRDSPLAQQLKELPTATAFYKETNRHWLWTRYTLVQEEGEWRIHDMFDLGAEAMQLPREELEQRMESIEAVASQRFNDVLQKSGIDPDNQDLTAQDVDRLLAAEDEDEDEDEDEALAEGGLADTLDQLQDAFQLMTQGLHYTDALIAQDPREDAEVYARAADSSAMQQDFERAAVYLQPMADLFPERRSEALKKLALAQVEIGDQYGESDEAREEHFLQLAETTLREAIKTDDAAVSYISLAELLIDPQQRYNEAEELLQQAEVRSPSDVEKSLIENARAHIADAQNRKEEALQHYQRAAAYNPKLSGVWYQLGRLQSALKHSAEAEQSLLRSVEQEPTLTPAYVTLASLYVEELADPEKAIDILEQGLEVNEQAADILAEYALVLILTGEDVKDAEPYLEQAEEIDPEMPLVVLVRQLFDTHKAQLRAEMKTKGATRKAQKDKSRKSKKR